MRAQGGQRAARLAILAAALPAALGCVAGADAGAEADSSAEAETEAEALADAEADLSADSSTEAEAEAEALADADGTTYPCLEPGLGTIVPTISIGDDTPLLSGGAIADGRYELSTVVLHARAALADRVSRFGAGSNGNTRGAVVFRDGAWGMTARLDLYFGMSIVAVGGVELDVPVTFEAAGPFEAVGGAIVTEPGACVVDATPECALEGAFRYEAEPDVVQLEVLWTKECLTSLLPYGYSFYVGMWLENDLPVVLRFSL